MDDRAKDFGDRLRELRLRARLSIGELAGEAGVSKSTMHGLEQGTGNPTLNTLWALATALGAPLGDLVEPPRRRTTVVRADEGTTMDTDGVRARLVHRGEANRLEIYELTIADRWSAAHRRDVQEHLFVTSGTVEAGPADAPVRLDARDFLAFDGSTAHVYRAVRAPARALVVMTYPPVQ